LQITCLIKSDVGHTDVRVEVANSDTQPASNLPRVYKALQYFGMETDAFSQLTREYMVDTFNPKTPDLPGVKYYSYGASLEPVRLSVFRPSFKIIRDVENAPNDGLVRYVAINNENACQC